MDFFKKTLSVNVCFVCQEEMGMIKLHRTHLCKRCGVQVCSKCSPNRIVLAYLHNDEKLDKTKPHRVCNFCYNDTQFFVNYIKTQDLRWNQPSKTFYEWKGYIQNTRYMETQKLLRKHEKVENEDIRLYQYCLSKAQSNEIFREDFESIKKDVESGRTDAQTFNYSTKEFVTMVQQGSGLDASQIRRPIQRLLEAAIMYNPLLGYCQGMNYIAAFLLCFCDEEGAFQLLTHLFDHILPDRFFQGGARGTALIGFLAEQHFLKQMIQSKFFDCYESLTFFVDYYAAHFLLTLLIQPFNASNLIVTWCEMFRTNSFAPIDIAMLYTMDVNRAIIQQGQNVQGLLEIICKGLDTKGLKEVLDQKKYYFTRFERKVYLEQFYTTQSRQWTSDDKMVIFRLAKITDFTKEEIVEIQREFKKYCVDCQNVQQEQHKLKPHKEDEDEDEVNLTESDEDEEVQNSLELSQIKAMQQFKYGITKPSFVSLMKNFHQHYADAQQKTMIAFEVTRYEQIFDMFDDQNCGSLDFREFLTCFSVLLRGTFSKKLELFFTAFGSKQHKYLNQEEFMILLNVLFNSYINQQDNDEQLRQQVDDFIRTRTQQFQVYKYLSYADIMGLTRDPFILNLDKEKTKSIVRRGTCMAMVSSLHDEIKRQHEDQ